MKFLITIAFVLFMTAFAKAESKSCSPENLNKMLRQIDVLFQNYVKKNVKTTQLILNAAKTKRDAESIKKDYLDMIKKINAELDTDSALKELAALTKAHPECDTDGSF